MVSGIWGFLLDATFIIGVISLYRILSRAFTAIYLSTRSTEDNDSTRMTGLEGFNIALTLLALLPTILVFFISNRLTQPSDASYDVLMSLMPVAVSIATVAVVGILILLSREIRERKRMRKVQQARLAQRAADIEEISLERDSVKKERLTQQLLERQAQEKLQNT